MVTGLSIAFIFSWQITLISLAIFPVIILAGKLQMDFSSGLSSKTDQEHRLTHEMVVTAISNIKTVRSLGLEKRILNNY